MNGPTDDRRDREIADALDGIPVPDYEPGFWDRLEQRLASEPAPTVATRETSAAGDDADAPLELAAVPSRHRRRSSPARRRSVAVLAAAAAVLIAVVAVRVVSDDGGEVHTATDPRTSTTAPIAALAGNRVTGQLHQAGSTGTPQDAFVAWVTALQQGDAAAARALVGPRTVRYYDALGGGLDQAGQGWEVWARPDGRRIEVIDFGEVQGEHVAGLVLTRPSTTTPDGVAYEAVTVVEGSSGWVVEPAAFDPDQDTRIEIVSPGADQDGLTALAPDAPVQVQVSGDGVYYVGADQGTLAGFVPADAHDGRISWSPAEPFRAGRHLLLVAHLSPKVLTMLAVPFPVA